MQKDMVFNHMRQKIFRNSRIVLEREIDMSRPILRKVYEGYK